MWAQDKIWDPRQVLTGPTWAADRGCGGTQFNGPETILVALFIQPRATFGLLCQANTHFLACVIWSMLIYKAQGSSQKKSQSSANFVDVCCFDFVWK